MIGHMAANPLESIRIRLCVGQAEQLEIWRLVGEHDADPEEWKALLRFGGAGEAPETQVRRGGPDLLGDG